MFNFIGWIVIGAAFGFWRAWKKTSASYAQAMQIVNETPITDRNNRAQTIGQIRGTRIAPVAIYTIGGGIVGALIYLAASGLRAVL